jgi:hypothetical protein
MYKVKGDEFIRKAEDPNAPQEIKEFNMMAFVYLRDEVFRGKVYASRDPFSNISWEKAKASLTESKMRESFISCLTHEPNDEVRNNMLNNIDALPFKVDIHDSIAMLQRNLKEGTTAEKEIALRALATAYWQYNKPVIEQIEYFKTLFTVSKHADRNEHQKRFIGFLATNRSIILNSSIETQAQILSMLNDDLLGDLEVKTLLVEVWMLRNDNFIKADGLLCRSVGKPKAVLWKTLSKNSPSEKEIMMLNDKYLPMFGPVIQEYITDKNQKKRALVSQIITDYPVLAPLSKKL